MPFLASLADPKNYHIITYGTLLGSNLFQSFLAGPVAYKALPRPQFATLQSAIFPLYFGFQSALPLLLAITFPGERMAGGAAFGGVRKNAGWRGLVGVDGNFWTALVPIGLMFLTSFVNLVALGPATTKTMKLRKHQETRDGKKYYDSGPHSEKMKRLNKEFATLHGLSSLANLIGTFTMLYYGVVLAEML